MAWYKAAWIPPLFTAFNTAFPNRTKASDGTIGDTAHQDSPSGHNPDDTPGSLPERTDADAKPEVRAGDVTSDLRDPRGVRMYTVVQSVLATPRDRDRLIYIICDGWIWRRSNRWRRETYDGSDKHFGHGHFSGDPAYDDDGAPWTSVLAFQRKAEAPVSDFDTTTSFQRPGQSDQDGDIGWGAGENPAPYGGVLRYAGWRVWVIYKQVKLILLGVQELLQRPVASIPAADLTQLRQDVVAGLQAELQQKIGATLVTALQSPEVQAAIVQAVNTAEDT